MIFIIDLGFLVLVILILSVLGILGVSVALNNIMSYILIPAVIITAIVHIIVIIYWIKENIDESKDSLPLTISGNIVFAIGEIIRSFINIVFLSCVCEGFLLNFTEATEKGTSFDPFSIVFSFLIFFLDIGLSVLILYVSWWGGNCIRSVVQECALLGGSVDAILSVIFFILVEALIGYGYPNTLKELFGGMPFLYEFLADPILFKIIRCFIS